MKSPRTAAILLLQALLLAGCGGGDPSSQPAHTVALTDGPVNAAQTAANSDPPPTIDATPTRSVPVLAVATPSGVQVDMAIQAPEGVSLRTLSTIVCNGHAAKVEREGVVFPVPVGSTCSAEVNSLLIGERSYVPTWKALRFSVSWPDGGVPVATAEVVSDSVTYSSVPATGQDERLDALFTIEGNRLTAAYPVQDQLKARPLGAPQPPGAAKFKRYYAYGPIVSTPMALRKPPGVCVEQAQPLPDWQALGAAAFYTVSTLLGMPWEEKAAKGGEALHEYTVAKAKLCPGITLGQRRANVAIETPIANFNLDDYELWSSTNCRCKCGPTTGFPTRNYCAIGEPAQVPADGANLEMTPVKSLPFLGDQAPSKACATTCARWCVAQKCTSVASAFALLVNENKHVYRRTPMKGGVEGECIKSTQEYNERCGGVPELPPGYPTPDPVVK